MTTCCTRRDFLAASAAAGVGLCAAGRLQAAPFKTTLHKAMIGMPTEKYLGELKAAGFDGIESTHKITKEDAAQARANAEKLGLRIHSVLRGWMSFNDPSKHEADIADITNTLETAKILGAETILVVPCRVSVNTNLNKPGKPGDLAAPLAWDFDIEFDEKTGMVSRVVKGDNTPYAAYIEAQNNATRLSREVVRRLIPAAEKNGVIICLENVWNNLWVLPKLAANFIGSFDNPWVRSYFDIGNHVKYAPPQDWIHTLGKLVKKCHVKDFKIDHSLANGGKFVHPRDGDINWPAVRQALDDVGYNGWLSIEDGGLPLEEFNRRFDLILAGK